MIYELRTYQLVRQNIGVFLDRFRAHTVAKFREHGIELVGCWMTEIGDGPELVLLLAFPELGARQRSFAALDADEEFAAARAAEPEYLVVMPSSLVFVRRIIAALPCRRPQGS